MINFINLCHYLICLFSFQYTGLTVQVHVCILTQLPDDVHVYMYYYMISFINAIILIV